MASGTRHIFQSLAVNVAIAVAKAVAAVFTGSGAMLAEAIHSAADCTNQVLLLIGVNRAAKRPDPSHPLGYGRALYFWSFLVALLLFTGGGVFSIYEGVHKLRAPEPIDHVLLAVGILVFSLALEGWATIGNLREMKARRGALSLVRYLRETKDSDLVVVFGENAAAVTGLGFALTCIGLAWLTGEPLWDGLGSLLVGIVLVAVAIFLAVEIKSLLIGERADPTVEAAVRELVAARPQIARLLEVISVQQGPGEVMVAMKLQFADGLSGAALVEQINALERELRARRADVRWCFVEPDVGTSTPGSA